MSLQAGPQELAILVKQPMRERPKILPLQLMMQTITTVEAFSQILNASVEMHFM